MISRLRLPCHLRRAIFATGHVDWQQFILYIYKTTKIIGKKKKLIHNMRYNYV